MSARSSHSLRSFFLAAAHAPANLLTCAVPMTAPEASSACTVTSGPAVPAGRAMAVSKPLRAAWATGCRVAGVAPADTLQPATSVAPFQLAYSVPGAGEVGRTTNVGAWAGAPAQSKRKDR